MSLADPLDAGPVHDTLAFLLGSWSIERVLSDHRDGSETTFRGRGEVAPASGGATYVESGEVHRGAHTGPARRTLRFVALPDGGVRVDFADGRPFIDLDLTAGSWAAIHPCRADTYAIDFAVIGPDAIRETWRVTGPEKDYTAETVWRRTQSPAAATVSRSSPATTLR